MSLNVSKLEEIASRDNANYKRYRDLKFLFEKLHFHVKNFKVEYSKELTNLKTSGKKNSIIQLKTMAKQLGQPIEKFYKPDVKLAVGFYGEMTNPLFFNFDSIMIDTKRIIEFFIKFLAIIMDEKPPKSIENFFKGLKNEVPTPSDFCDTITDDYNDYAISLIKNWDDWINELNDYRTNAIHKSVENRIDGKVKTHWKPNTPIETLIIRSITVNFRNKDIIQYVKNLETNLATFYGEGRKFIVDC